MQAHGTVLPFYPLGAPEPCIADCMLLFNISVQLIQSGPDEQPSVYRLYAAAACLRHQHRQKADGSLALAAILVHGIGSKTCSQPPAATRI